MKRIGQCYIWKAAISTPETTSFPIAFFAAPLPINLLTLPAIAPTMRASASPMNTRATF